MKLWISLLGLLLVACAAAFGWQMLAADPGYVLVHIGSTRIETSVVFAVVAVLLIFGLWSLIWRALRWPRAMWTRRAHKRGHERIASGLIALVEGNYRRSQRDLARASHQSGLRAPAQLAAAYAAHAAGDDQHAQKLLDSSVAEAPCAAQILRARFALDAGDANAALASIEVLEQNGAHALNASRLQIESALLCGKNALALQGMQALVRRGALPAISLQPLQARVLAAALNSAVDAESLGTLWSGLSRNQRAVPEAIAAYARRAASLGQTLAAMDELESALQRNWSELLIRTYGELGQANADTRLRRAEGWLDKQPDSPGLLLALGRLCTHGQVWGKANEYLQNGLALAPSAALWEALGDCRTAQNASADAAICYRNALRCARGEATQALPVGSRGKLDTRASAVERRNVHGVPQLGNSGVND
ncbi:MAG TPA: heme biosynthesis HemY N-terminal domain-containing protein [Rudaea sp.]|nr:heme biosynthesis HemY N-terminal domain-containing protein [Rudaea sp.]